MTIPCSEEQTRETLPLRRQPKIRSQGDHLNPRTTCLVSNQRVLETISWNFRNRNYSTICNDKDNNTRDITNKVILNSSNTVLYFFTKRFFSWFGILVRSHNQCLRLSAGNLCLFDTCLFNSCFLPTMQEKY